MSARVVFVSGIDTGIGKTYATGYLARREMEKGLKVATLKLVQTGNEGFSEDIKTHREIMGASLPEDADFTTAPQIFRFPSSPELAARLEGRPYDIFIFYIGKQEEDYERIDKSLAQILDDLAAR